MPVPLEATIITGQLKVRRTRPPNHEAHNSAIASLVDTMSVIPGPISVDKVLQRLVEAAVVLCGAHSAGVSILEKMQEMEAFRCSAVAGTLSAYLGCTMQRESCICGTVLERNAATLVGHPDQCFPLPVGSRPIHEMLLVPFCVRNRPIGTVWIIAHDEERKFDVEDVRLMTSLSRFGGLAYQMLVDERQRLIQDLTALERLHELSSQLVHQDPSALYEKIIDTAIAIMNSDFASMQMLYPNRGISGELRLLASHGFSENAKQLWEWVSADSPCVCGLALKTGRRVIVQNVQDCQWLVGTQGLLTYLNTGIRAVQSTPLFSRSGRLLGMISTHWREPHRPTERDLRLFDLLARQAADLIDRSATEQALRQIKHRDQALTEAGVLIFWSTDASGAFVEEQESWAAYTGQSWRQHRGLGWVDMVHPDDRDRVRTLWEHSVSSKGKYFTTGRLWHRPSNSYRRFELRGIPLLAPNGEVREWTGVCIDVEDREPNCDERLAGEKPIS